MKRAATIVCALLGACVSALPEPYVVDDLRIVAAVAEPPEAKPGAVIMLTFYFAHPRDDIAAPQVRIGRCSDPAALSCSVADEATLALGVAEKINPHLWRYVYTYGLASDARDVDIVQAHATLAEDRIDGFKRVVVSDGTTAVNHNPILRDVYVVDGMTIGTAATVPPSLQRGHSYLVLPDYEPEKNAELYVVTHDDGTTTAAQEDAFLTWICGAPCTIDRPVTHGLTSMQLTPTGSDGPMPVFVVMRDGRGGETLKVLDATVSHAR